MPESNVTSIREHIERTCGHERTRLDTKDDGTRTLTCQRCGFPVISTLSEPRFLALLFRVFPSLRPW